MSNLFAFVLVAAHAALPEGFVDARVVVETPVVPFHQQVTLRVIVETEGAMDVTFAPMGPDKLSGLNVYGMPEISQESTKSGGRRIVETYTLDPIFPGYYVISPVEVRVDGERAFEIPAPAVRIRELTGEEEADIQLMADNAGPADLPTDSFPVGAVAAGTIAALLLGAGFLYWRFRMRDRTTEHAAIATPWEVAYRRLRQLDAKGWPAAGKFEPYYVELSDVLRRYVEARYRLHAPERTTPEFLAEASSSGVLHPDHERLLAEFLRHSDRVKFARYAPSLQEMDKSLEDVLRFVDETIPKPEPAEAAAA